VLGFVTSRQESSSTITTDLYVLVNLCVDELAGSFPISEIGTPGWSHEAGIRAQVVLAFERATFTGFSGASDATESTAAGSFVEILVDDVATNGALDVIEKFRRFSLLRASTVAGTIASTLASTKAGIIAFAAASTEASTIGSTVVARLTTIRFISIARLSAILLTARSVAVVFLPRLGIGKDFVGCIDLFHKGCTVLVLVGMEGPGESLVGLFDLGLGGILCHPQYFVVIGGR